MTDLNTATETQWFGSAVDWWLGLIIGALPLIQIWTLITAVRSGEREALLAAVFGCAVVAGIYGLVLFPIRYGISSDELIIRFGVVRQRIRLREIREVYPTHNPLASPALSLDRLAIRTGDGRMAAGMISPADRARFLGLLAARAGLAEEGDRLVRR